nr:hypothetical protein [Myxococcus sp. CA056]
MTGLTDVQGTLFFTITPTSGGSGAVLWRSTGTEAGTVQVRVFPAGVVAEGASVAVGNKFFFPLHDQGTGMVQLWVSDGTTSGTRFLEDFTPDLNGPSLHGATAINGRLVFFHLTSSANTEPWSSDGTSADTVRVANLTGVLALYFNQTLQVGNALLFFQSQGGATTLWRTDGTLAGTKVPQATGESPSPTRGLPRSGGYSKPRKTGTGR